MRLDVFDTHPWLIVLLVNLAGMVLCARIALRRRRNGGRDER